jgi:hypothetical protein
MSVIEISCIEVWQEVSNYLDNEVDAELRERMEAHFKVCNHCFAIMDGTRNTLKLVGDDVSFELPQGFSNRLREKLKDSGLAR